MDFRAPIGTDDFGLIRRNRWAYVDKSPLIGALLEDGALVVLLPRPRRFGKSTNLSMLRAFFERSNTDHTALFSDLAIWQSERAKAHFQRHPVVSISCKDLKAQSWDAAQADLTQLLSTLAREFTWLLDHPAITPLERADLLALMDRSAPESLRKQALRLLTELLHRATGERVVVLIDEYDTPIHAGWLGGYYDEIIHFFRVFFGAGLKGNPALFKGVMTGILRISKESIFSDINNLAVYSLLRPEYNTAFGFTEAEVEDLASQAGATRHLPTLRRWYNGYRCGGVTLFNPWSVVSFLASQDRKPRPYWANTSSNALIGQVITRGQEQLSLEFERLLAGGAVRKRVSDGIVLPELDHNTDAVWNLLLFSGYLKPAHIYANGEVRLAIPNREVMSAFDELLHRWLAQSAGGSAAVDRLLQAMLAGEAERFELGFSDLVRNALSVHEVTRRDPERVFHAFTLGLLVQLRASHRVESNAESGYGRADVLLIPRSAGQPGVVFEFKRLRKNERVEHALDAAMEQLSRLAYASKLREAGAAPVRCYGVVFDGKRAYLRMVTEPA